jgi:hypothetical protein
MERAILPVLPEKETSLYENLTGFEESPSIPVVPNANKELHKIRDTAALMIQTTWNRYQMIKTYKWMKFNLYRTVYLGFK